MEIITFGDKDKKQYNDFLFNSKYKDILQSWEWGDVKSKLNWRAERLGFFKERQLVGLAQVLERKLPLGFSLFYIPRGPVIDWQNYQLVKEVITCLKENFREKIKNNKTLFLRLEPPVKKNEELLAVFKDLGFKNYFKTIQPPRTLLIDLNLSEDELIKRFRRTARNLIRRSEKEGMMLDVLTGSQITSDYLRGFYNLYRSTGERFSFPLRPYKQFLILKEVMGKEGMIKLYIAKIKGLILAYGIILLCGGRAFYIWGGTGRHRDYSKFFNYGYIWGMLKDLKKEGIEIFDFWGLGPENNPNHPWSGFTLFKTAFDGNPLDYLGAFDLPISRLYPLFRLTDRIMTPKYRATSS